MEIDYSAFEKRRKKPVASSGIDYSAFGTRLKKPKSSEGESGIDYSAFGTRVKTGKADENREQLISQIESSRQQSLPTDLRNEEVSRTLAPFVRDVKERSGFDDEQAERFVLENIELRDPRDFGMSKVPEKKSRGEQAQEALPSIEEQNAVIRQAPERSPLDRATSAIGDFLFPSDPTFETSIEGPAPNIRQDQGLGGPESIIREVGQGFMRNLGIVGSGLTGQGFEVEPETEFQSRVTGVGLGESAGFEREGRDIAGMFGLQEAPGPVFVGIGMLSAGLDAADIFTGPGKKKVLLESADALFDAARRGDGSFDSVARQEFVGKLNVSPEEAESLLGAVRPMVNEAQTSKQLRKSLEEFADQSELMSKARRANTPEEFQESLTSRQQKKVRDMGVSDADVFRTARAVDEAKPVARRGRQIADRAPERQVAEQVMRRAEGIPTRQADIPEELRPLAEEARRFDSAEEFVEAQPKVFRGGEEGNWVTLERDFAKEYGEVSEFSLTKKPRLLQVGLDEADEIAQKLDADPLDLYFQPNKELKDELLKRGYDGFENGDNIYLLDRGVLKTRSQLTDLYNRANSDTAAPAGTQARRAPASDQPIDPATQARSPGQTAPAELGTRTDLDVSQGDSSLENSIRDAKEKVDLDKAPPAETNRTVGEDWRGIVELPEETGFEAFRRTVEDFNIRLKTLNRTIEEVAGATLPEHLDLWAKKDMLPRQQSDMLRRLRDEKMDFARRMTEADVGVDELGEYLHAKHAKERNAKMNEVRKAEGKEPMDAPSGMSDEAADEILARDNSRFTEFEDEIRRKTDDILDFQVEQGLLKAEDADRIRNAYGNYVPLYRDVDDSFLGIGSGADIRGPEVRRARGSEREVLNPLGNVFQMEERVRIRALKNDIGKTIKNLTEEFPDAQGLFKIEKQKYMPRFDENGDLQFLDPEFKLADNVIGTKIDGTQYFITVNDALMAKSLKSLDLARVPWFMQPLRTGLGVWSAFKTRLRPEFLVTNFQRDLGEALVNLNVEELKLTDGGKNLKFNVAKNTLPSQRKIWKYVRGGDDADVDEFFRLGGDAGHFWLEDINRTQESLLDLEKQMKNEGIEKIKNPARKAGKLIEDVNTAVELGVRYSAYQELRKAGMSQQKAIQATADLTINFSRQGEFSPVMKSLYGFINPTIQGASKVIRTTTAKGATKRMTKALGGIIMLGAVNRTVSMMMDPEGDEQINDWAKNHKLTFAIGNGNTVTLWSLPYGYTAFHSIGSNLAEVMFGKKTFTEGLGHVGNTTINSFSPFDTNINSWIPTLAKPIFETRFNEGWYGGNIHPEQVFTDTPKPNADVYFDNTSQAAIFASELLKRVSGGGEGRAGVIDVHPDDIEYMYDQYFGGPFEFMTSSIEASARGVDGKFDPNNTPFVRQVFREGTPQNWSYSTIYDTLDRSYKYDISELETDRFYRAVETGVEEEIFDQDRGDQFIRKFIKAKYRIDGDITSDENASKLREIPREERDKLIDTYAPRTQRNLGGSGASSGSGLDDIFGGDAPREREPARSTPEGGESLDDIFGPGGGTQEAGEPESTSGESLDDIFGE